MRKARPTKLKAIQNQPVVDVVHSPDRVSSSHPRAAPVQDAREFSRALKTISDSLGWEVDFACHTLVGGCALAKLLKKASKPYNLNLALLNEARSRLTEQDNTIIDLDVSTE